VQNCKIDISVDKVQTSHGCMHGKGSKLTLSANFELQQPFPIAPSSILPSILSSGDKVEYDAQGVSVQDLFDSADVGVLSLLENHIWHPFIHHEGWGNEVDRKDL
jgi:hypothetical protein